MRPLVLLAVAAVLFAVENEHDSRATDVASPAEADGGIAREMNDANGRLSEHQAAIPCAA